MKVLLLTPYSPLLHHDHAANDIALPLVKALAPFMDLHVYAPGQKNGQLSHWHVNGATYYAGSPVPTPTRLSILGSYPRGSRASWSRRSTKEALAVVRKVKPDILHAEYWQTAEPLLRSGHPYTSITLHDLPCEITLKPIADISRIRYWLAQLEEFKTRRVWKKLVSSIDAIFVRSERDKDRIAESQAIVAIAPVGVDPPAVGWTGENRHVAAFGGAMWRLENEASAIYLANEVMPLVRESVQDAELRIFGARPTAAVQELAFRPGVTVVGEVEDYDGEFRRAAVTLAPAMVDAGLLLKSIRAMAMGCPVVLNTASASPIVGIQDGIHAVVGDSPRELAFHIVALLQDKARARQLGEAARELVLAQFSWERVAEVHCTVFEQLLRV
jgi:glycosyltransferase involved in cell wall biosynthesis